MKILVTGVAGFIGSNFVYHYLDEHPDREIIGIDNLSYAGNLENLLALNENQKSRFELIKADITDQDAINKIFAERQVDGVINMAAETHVDRSIHDPQVFLKTNILGTHNLLDCAKRSWYAHGTWLPGKKFLQVSTDEVYGSLGPMGLFSEATPLDPHSPYSASKASADLIVKAYHDTYGMPMNITRCSNNYGPYQFPEKLIPVVIQSVLERKPVPVYGDGMNVRDWLYVRDHAEALWLVLTRGRAGETYNIGGHNEWANLPIVQLICDLIDEMAPQLGGNSRKLITFVKDRPGHDRRYAIDATKIEQALGWLPAHKFEQGIRETVRWYLDHQEWVRSVLKR